MINAASRVSLRDESNALSNQSLDIMVEFIFWQQIFFLILQDLQGQHPGAALLPVPEY